MGRDRFVREGRCRVERLTRLVATLVAMVAFMGVSSTAFAGIGQEPICDAVMGVDAVHKVLCPTHHGGQH